MTAPKPGLAVATLAVVAAALSGGCAVVQSTHEGAADARRGMVYMLPKALLPVELVEADGVLMLRVKPAVMVGDTAQRYFVSPGANAFSSDDVKIEVDAATGLLSKITASAEDQTLSVIGELVKARGVRKAEGGSAGGETVLFGGLLDPDPGRAAELHNGRLLAGIEEALLGRLKARVASCAAAANPECADARQLHDRLLATGRAGKPVVVVKASPLVSGPAEGASAVTPRPTTGGTAPCDQGVCHRALQPFVIELAITGVQQQSTLVLLPNGGAPIALPLDRAPFVKTEYEVEFIGGQLQSVHTKKPSSALALVKWPLEIYQAVLESTATLIQLRVGANKAEVDLAQSQLDTARELKRIREEMEKLSTESGDVPLAGTRLGGPRRGDALLAVEMGSRPAVSVIGAAVPPPRNGGSLPAPAPAPVPGQPGQPKP